MFKNKDKKIEADMDTKEGIPTSCEEPAEAEEKDNNITIARAEYDNLVNKAKEEDAVNEKCLRLQAEFDNYRKRLAKEKDDFCRYAQEGLIFELLGILDDFERAILAANKTEDFKVLSDGVEMVSKRFLEILKKKGLEKIEPVGTPFNPTFHEAVTEVVSEEHPEHTVVEEMLKGYVFHGRILRPAQVKVSVKPTIMKEDANKHGTKTN
ncbi:MAG: nucleotide exchange factor GrpE [Candidatus Omnitrophica bacterium]|nr:nucleotide exchange factor GrpE [Candidatus Omnitrophota bacterium]